MQRFYGRVFPFLLVGNIQLSEPIGLCVLVPCRVALPSVAEIKDILRVRKVLAVAGRERVALVPAEDVELAFSFLHIGLEIIGYLEFVAEEIGVDSPPCTFSSSCANTSTS